MPEEGKWSLVCFQGSTVDSCQCSAGEDECNMRERFVGLSRKWLVFHWSCVVLLWAMWICKTGEMHIISLDIIVYWCCWKNFNLGKLISLLLLHSIGNNIFQGSVGNVGKCLIWELILNLFLLFNWGMCGSNEIKVVISRVAMQLPLPGLFN